MNSQLADLISQLENAHARLDRLGDLVPEDRWSRRNDQSRWSAGECVAHLNLTSEAYIPRIRKAIEEARTMPPKTGGAYRPDLIGRIFGKLVGPIPKIGKLRIGKVRTTPAFVPNANLPKQQLLSEFKRLQLELMRQVRECDGLPIDKVKIVSPFGEKIHYDCYSALVLLPRHQERHLEQAELVWSE
jgi:hypothetical protein